MEQIISLITIESLTKEIKELEHRYGVSSEKMIRDEQARDQIPIDIITKWETLIFQRYHLRVLEGD